MLNWLTRYQPVIRLLDDLRPATVLDVGAGAHGLSYYWAGHVIQTDLKFDQVPEVERVGSAEFVEASADNLPFADGSVDVAVSVDMIEHLPVEIRATSVAELYRVARHAVILAYPVGEVARKLDLRFARVARRLGELPVWLQEHLAQESYPTRELAEQSVPEGWKLTRVEREHNHWLQLALTLLEITPRLNRLTTRLERWGRTHRLPQPLRRGGSYRYYFLAERVRANAA